MHFPSYKNELKYLKDGYDLILGCDEVGIGPLAGPVVACACILNPKSIGKYRSKNKWYYRVRDSKTTSEAERKILVKEILENTFAFGIGEVGEKEIDKINIHNASLKAMRLATENLMSKISRRVGYKKFFMLVDGKFNIPGISSPQKNMIKGDREVLSISAASIIAKVHRDKIMRELDRKFPGYGLARHKGYGTKEHQRVLRELGPLSIHRKSFIKIV